MLGFQKKKKPKNKEKQYLSSLIVPFSKKMPIKERILKFIIYISFRLSTKPSQWKHPQKNLEIINRAYKKIISSDFVFIPASIAYYLLMSFVPLITIISLLTQLPVFEKDNMFIYLSEVFKGFIPGLDKIWESISNSEFSAGTFTGIATLLVSSLWISSSGFSQLIYTQSHLYKHKYIGGYWRSKIKGILIVIFFSFMLFLGISINFLFIRFIRGIDNTELSDFQKSLIIKSFLYIGLIFLIFFIYITLFKFSPQYKIKIRYIIPGAIIATLPSIVFISIFGLIGDYLSYKNFGYIGTFLYVGLLVIVISYFTFVGLIVNVSYYKTFVNKKLASKKIFFNKYF